MGWKSPVVIRNAPVVYMSMLERTDGSRFDPAHVWYTGMCLVGAKCTDKDFVPRNDLTPPTLSETPVYVNYPAVSL